METSKLPSPVSVYAAAATARTAAGNLMSS